MQTASRNRSFSGHEVGSGSGLDAARLRSVRHMTAPLPGDAESDLQTAQSESDPRLPLIGADQHRRRRTVFGDGDLILGQRNGVDVLVELVLDPRNRQDPHTTIMGCNIDLITAEIKADNKDYGPVGAAPNTATTCRRRAPRSCGNSISGC